MVCSYHICYWDAGRSNDRKLDYSRDLFFGFSCCSPQQVDFWGSLAWGRNA